MASPALEQPAAAERGGNACDVAGVMVLGCCAAWALITAAGRDARPEGTVLAVLALAAGYAGGRIAGSLLPAGAPAVAALAGLGLALGWPGTLPDAATDADLLGRTGATAALLALAAGTACCAAAATTSRRTRPALRLLAGGMAAAALAADAPEAAAAALAVLLCSLAAERIRHRLPVLALLAASAAAVTGGAWAVAGQEVPDGLAAAVEGQLTERRTGLWQDALALTTGHPLLGSGPDGFGDRSPTAREAATAPGKPHSAPLQIAAEQGLPGLALLAAAFGWLLVALLISPRPTPVVITAAVALTVLAGLAGVSNALSFTEVTTGAGLLAGIATARRAP